MLNRKPSNKNDFVRGSAFNVPFKFGGLINDEASKNSGEKDNLELEGEVFLNDYENERFEEVAPGFEVGIQEKEEKTTEEIHNIIEEQSAKEVLKQYIVPNEEHQEIVNQSNRSNRSFDQARNETRIKLTDFFQSPNAMLSTLTTLNDELQDLESDKEEEEEELNDKAEDQREEEDRQKESKIEKETDELQILLQETGDILKHIAKKKNPDDVFEYVKVHSNEDPYIKSKRINELVASPALEYPFDLDVFQKQAIVQLENNQSVFVAAHTSAGKTVVAEYAIALGKKHFTRVIYTSPIKTLSNQKFREFREKFGEEHVGILTGDVQVNPTASCLIMTTEILRSMLYRGADLVRDVEYVIFDEVHYLNDTERGVVWEEVIIMLPEHVNMIMLSATIPNTKQFAEWLGRTKKKTIHVMSTLKRPVPLEHHLYFKGEIEKVVDHRSGFMHKSYAKIKAVYEDDLKKQLKKHKRSGFRSETNEWVRLIDILKRRNLLPVTVFSFSRRKCETISKNLTTLNLTTVSEKKEIQRFVKMAISRLSKIDRELPQVVSLGRLVNRGIGMHHSGMLPIVKEMVEMLFSRGLIKVLFATETFAMGVNMPTKCVVFNGIRKHDGTAFRNLESSEYIQMSGRAGRRGLDTTGMVIIMCMRDIIDQLEMQRLTVGQSTLLSSQFRLTYAMILNLMRIQHYKITDIMKRSFLESDNQQYHLGSKQELFDNCLTSMDRLNQYKCVLEEPDIEDAELPMVNYVNYSTEMRKLDTAIIDELTKADSKVKKVIFKKGRAFIVLDRESNTFTLAVLDKFIHQKGQLEVTMLKRPTTTKRRNYPVVNPNYINPDSSIPYTIISGVIVSIAKHEVIRCCDHLFLPNKKPTVDQIFAVINDPKKLLINELKCGMNTIEFVEMMNRRNGIRDFLMNHKCGTCHMIADHYQRSYQAHMIDNQISVIKDAMSESNLELKPECDIRVDVLKKLNYIHPEQGTIQLKGRVACEMRSCNELVITEMLFDNFFEDLNPKECVCAVSALVNQVKEDKEYPLELDEKMMEVKTRMESLVLSLGGVQMDCGLKTSPTEFLNDVFRPALMRVAYEWAAGVDFVKICQITSVQEGNIVRCINHICHALREVRNAAKVLGDASLYQKMEDATNLIKRDIV
eukprot:CAMPEP_0117419238 /NCGR_PEP_ID=MMETSP0758-20121206/848_1 /TAXON_ID=63605 /ORGANISM="Percolomonas cosmopolitus, Strain AE-1 (ATCC 50343)" /LENGTH=1143 /DNA_ID=CAMNT_0005200199 /DNA_START=505 /DNA_END=3932 /DNA_ORIENTATION=+